MDFDDNRKCLLKRLFTSSGRTRNSEKKNAERRSFFDMFFCIAYYGVYRENAHIFSYKIVKNVKIDKSHF